MEQKIALQHYLIKKNAADVQNQGPSNKPGQQIHCRMLILLLNLQLNRYLCHMQRSIKDHP